MSMKLFVSYHRSDHTAVERLVDELRRRQHTVWTDQQLYVAQVWWSEILDQIKQVDAVVLAVSPAYLASQACAAERAYASACRRPLVPFAVVPVSDLAWPADLAAIQHVESVRELIDELRLLPPTPPLPRPLPERPAAPFSRYALLRDEICTQPLDVGRQFGIVAELYLYSRSAEPAAEAAGHQLLNDVSRSAYLYAAPMRLLEELRRPVGSTSPPWPAILGAALGGIGFANLLIVIGIYRIVPRPWDFVTPNVALALLGAALCCFALRRHLPSALIGLSVCFVSIAAAAINMLKYFHKI
jgi:hypothetical protein